MEKYLKTGIWYSLALSGTYLPLILGYANGGNFNTPLIVIDGRLTYGLGGIVHFYGPIIGGLILFSALNYLYIYFVRNMVQLRKFNSYLIIANLFLLFPATKIATKFFRIEMNVFAFSIFFCFIPWTLYLLYTFKKHRSAQS